VIKGAGEKAFVAGADISEFADASPVKQRDVMNSRSLFTVLDTFPKPIIAMINGFCLGGGTNWRWLATSESPRINRVSDSRK
jgi:enoyl-CoA hydratase